MTPESNEPSKMTARYQKCVYQKSVNNLLPHLYKFTDKQEIEATAQQFGDCNNLVGSTTGICC